MKERSILFPVLMVIFSILALISISQFDNPRFQDASVNAKFFPAVVSCLIIVISVLLAFQNRLKNEAVKNSNPIFSKLAIFGIAFLLAYVLLIGFIGYLPASVIAFTVYLIVFKINRPSYYAIALTFVVAIYYLFSEVFIISLPQGSLF